jgi:hypothetical protein
MNSKSINFNVFTALLSGKRTSSIVSLISVVTSRLSKLAAAAR